MSIESVDMDRALSSASYAQQVLRSGNVSTEQKGQLVAKWGTENVNKWLSVDSTDYEIDDVDYDSAKEAGKEAAKDSVGYDGGKSGKAVLDVASSGAGTAAATFSVLSANKAGLNIGRTVVGKTSEGLANKGAVKAAKVSAIVAAGIAIATAAKYMIEKPNKKQVEATQQLLNKELPDAKESLEEAQAMMAEASEEVTELTEEADELNEDANDKIEENKTMFDFYKQQYDALKAKKESGEKLTPDEQALMKELAPLMEGLNEEITTIADDTSEKVNDLNDNIAEYEETYDDSAENIAEVEGVTDYAENFDENTKTMSYVEAAAQGLNAVTGFTAGAKLLSGLWTAFLGSAAILAGYRSTTAMVEQMNNAKQVSNEIDKRREIQDLGSQTYEMYEEELDNYAGNIETVEDLELEIPEDMEVQSEQGGADASMMSMAAQNSENEQEQTTPMGTKKQDESQKVTNDANANGTNKNDKENNNKKKIEE